MNLCIAAPDFHQASGTFIRDHVRSIAPGSTFLLCLNARGVEQLGCPVLAEVESWTPPRSLKERIINAFHIRWRRYVDPNLLVADRLRVRAFFKTNRVKAVLAEYGPVGCLLVRACNEAEVPLYVHFHGFVASFLIRDARQVRFYRALFRNASGIITPSRFLAEKLKEIGCPNSKLHVIPYGVDPKRFRPSHRVPQRAVAVGRLVDKKAPHLTIEAFARVIDRFPEARLEVVGGGPLEEKCRALIRDRGLGYHVYMHGIQGSDFVARLLRGGALFAQHSVTAEDGDTEGLPVAILEAMASALPVVSTRHSGIPEAVLHNVTGYLVEEHDVDAMAAAMTKLFDHPECATTMGIAGRERVLAHFTQERARDRLRNIMGFPPFSAHTQVSAKVTESGV